MTTDPKRVSRRDPPVDDDPSPARPCPVCRGTGRHPNDNDRTCPECNEPDSP